MDLERATAEAASLTEADASDIKFGLSIGSIRLIVEALAEREDPPACRLRSFMEAAVLAYELSTAHR